MLIRSGWIETRLNVLPEDLIAMEVQALTGDLAHPEDVRMHSVGVEPG